MDSSSVPPLADPLAPFDRAAALPEPDSIEPTPIGQMTGQRMPAPVEHTYNMAPVSVNDGNAPPASNSHSPLVPGNRHVQDVAMSLVSLGRASPTGEEAAAHTAGVPMPDLPPLQPNANITDPNVTVDAEEANKRPQYTHVTTATKYTMKPRDPKRDTSIPFEEMQRLMRVYGPIKCLRNRTTKESGKELKQESIKRKFYRWFPDFDSRFERTPEGWFKPKYGHEEEMQYRADMRKKDQDELVKKRNTKRTSRKAKEAHETVTHETLPENVAPELSPIPQADATQVDHAATSHAEIGI